MAWKHRLLEKDAETLRGVCQRCGPVALVSKGRRKILHCRLAILSQKCDVGTHGIRLDEARLIRENKPCSICGRIKSRMALDHDHKTGQIRGVLCINCNMGLGHFEDCPKRLAAAIRYLIRILKEGQQT